jgi:hypothetical protein
MSQNKIRVRCVRELASGFEFVRDGQMLANQKRTHVQDTVSRVHRTKPGQIYACALAKFRAVVQGPSGDSLGAVIARKIIKSEPGAFFRLVKLSLSIQKGDTPQSPLGTGLKRRYHAKSIFSHSCHLSISRNKGKESVTTSLRTSWKRLSKSCSASVSVRGKGGPDSDRCPYKKMPINLPPADNRSAISNHIVRPAGRSH